jgi:serine/threonine protein phosphatase PrpC
VTYGTMGRPAEAGYMSTTEQACPDCHAPLDEGDVFCEHCGTRLPDRQASPSSEDRTELDLAVAAAVSDRGLIHRRNEDSFRLEVGPDGSVAAVVCDGTSSASAGNAAAREAALAASRVLSAAIADPTRDACGALGEAIQAAQGAVEQVPWTTRTKRVDPACTLVSALCRDAEITIGWVGDSRAYWVDGAGTRQLTIDDSFAAEGVAKGLLTAEQAAKSPFLHSITDWLGATSPERPPRTVVLRPDLPGRLMLCTDGLWNYAPTVTDLAELLEALPADASAAEAARALIDVALDRGGHDNVTVAVVDVDPSH